MNPAFRSSHAILHALSDIERAQLKETLHAMGTDAQSLQHALVDPEHISHVISHASVDALSALKAWVLQSGQWRDATHQGRLEDGIRELVQCGWVFETYYGPHRRLRLMPWDLMPQLVPHLWDIPWAQLTEPSSPREIAPASLWSPIVHDLFQVISYARQDTLLLTGQREVYRRQKIKMEKWLWPRAHLSPRVTLEYLLITLEHLGFFDILDTPFRFKLTEAADQFMHKSPAEVFQVLVEFVCDPARMGWPGLLWMSLASHVPPDETLNITQAMKWMAQIGLTSATNNYLLNQAVRDLVTFDIMEVNEKEAARLTPWAYAALHGRFEEPEPQSSLIQPTGEILVPPAVPLSDRWAIDALASRVKSDRVCTYRVDQSSVQRGVQRSMTWQSHVQGIQQLVRNPLSDNIRVNLEDWYRLIGRHRIMQVTIVHSQNPGDSRNVQTLLGKDAIDRLSDTDIIIRDNRIHDILKKLERSGAPILPEVLKPSQPNREPQNTGSSRLLLEWAIRLPTEPSTQDVSIEDLRDLITQASRDAKPLRITYQIPGESQTTSEVVYPVTVEHQWVQVYTVHQRRYILIDWRQILAAEPDDGPV